MARVEVENPKIKEARGIPWDPSPERRLSARTIYNFDYVTELKIASCNGSFCENCSATIK